MINKIVISLLFIFLALPIYAGSFEDAKSSKPYVFLYLYTPECGYCQRFTPKYFKFSKMYDKSFAFVMEDANQYYGNKLIRKYKGKYVPYVVLYNSKTKKAASVPSYCIMKDECVDKAIKQFKNL